MTSEEYGQYIDDFELGADVMPGESLTDYIERRRREFDSKADGGAIGIEVLFTEKKKNGGRIGFDNGGQTAPAGTFTLTDYVNFLNTAGDFNRLFDKGEKLVGEAGEFVEQVGDKEYDDYTGKELIKERELEGKLENLEDEFAKTEDDYYDRTRDIPADEEAMGAYARQLINDLNQRNVTLDTLAEIAGLKKGGRVGLFMGGPALEGQALQIYNSMKGYNFSDQEIADALSARGLYTPAGSGTTQPQQVTGIIGTQLNQGGDRVTGLQETFTKDLSGNPRFNYLTPQQQANKYRFDRSVEPREGLMGFFDKTKNFFAENRFFQPKVRGTLGTRLANQPRLPLPGSIAAYSMSPLNPDSKNYSPDLVEQLNLLELGDDIIGRDPGSGLLRYGSGSVLRGQNVISGFGSNNYLKQLNKYINRKNITDKARQRGIDERNKFLAEQEAKQKAQLAAQLAAAQREIDRMGYKDYGSGGGLDPSLNDPVTGEYTGASKQDYGSGEKDGGIIGYQKGGLTTMFTRRR